MSSVFLKRLLESGGGKMSKKTTTNDLLDQHEANHAIKNYTRVPNMLVDGYPELHPQDKWLFVCLVRMCGKEGTRYLSLRYIADRTGFSRGPLGGSKDKPGMIQRLHNAGLIHAEIKRRKSPDGNEKNNAQYHITIADTWRLNYAFYNETETCPDSGQEEKRTQEPVLNQDATCPKSGQDIPEPVLNQDATCPDSGPTVILQDKITESNKITERKNGESDQKEDILESDFHPSFPPEKPEEEFVLTEEGQRIYDYACQELYPAENPPVTAKLKAECEKLAIHVKNIEQFLSLLTYAQTRLKPPYHLKNMVNALNDWLQVQKFAEPATPQPTNALPTTPGKTTNLIELLQMQEARKQAMQNERGA
jgi:hypothetical protein